MVLSIEAYRAVAFSLINRFSPDMRRCLALASAPQIKSRKPLKFWRPAFIRGPIMQRLRLNEG